MRMINYISFCVSNKCIAVFIKPDAVYLLCHRGVIKLDSDNTDEYAVLIYRNIVG